MLGYILATLVKHESKAKIDAAATYSNTIVFIAKRESHVNLAYAIHLSKYAKPSFHIHPLANSRLVVLVITVVKNYPKMSQNIPKMTSIDF